ncbi:MAG: prepilin-type N-terminal cleavage/methylation domain-containing protein [Acetobacteraceae bacterium]|nr:prepilin-type N-terminal cleavage/methylation domain-containing protein [Acetobacteraceae bacterium]
MKVPPQGPNRDGGFTLMETLVALVVLGFVVAGLAQGLRFGVAAWNRQARSIDRDGALDATDRTLRTLFAAMVPAGDPQSPAIVGSRDRLAFVADLPVGAPVTPIRLSDTVVGVDGAHRLVLRWTPHLHARVLTPAIAQEAVLLPGVDGVTFAYYRAGGQGHPGAWTDRWQGVDPPLLVRMHIEFRNHALHWPDLIVAPERRQDVE